jgi:hypothetical protein
MPSAREDPPLFLRFISAPAAVSPVALLAAIAGA